MQKFDDQIFNYALQGDLQKIREYHSFGGSLNCADADGMTPLIVATMGTSFETVKFLIDNGANIHHQMSNGMSPLYCATLNGNYDVVHLLLKLGANVNVQHNETPLTAAARNGKERIRILELLINFGASVNHQIPNGRTALFFACAFDHMDAVEFLLQKGADPNIRENINPKLKEHSGYSSFEIASPTIQSYINNFTLKEARKRYTYLNILVNDIIRMIGSML